MLTIALIDENLLTRLALTMILDSKLERPQIIESDSLSQLLNHLPSKNPDVLVMGSYDRSINDALHKIIAVHEQFPTTPFIVYDQRKDYKMTDLYFQIGVAGHLLKHNIGTQIVPCIKAVLSGKHYLCPSLSKTVLDSFVSPDKKEILTDRQAEIAKLLVQGKKTSWIASSLQRKPSTISSTKQKIFRKLKVASVVELSKILPGL